MSRCCVVLVYLCACGPAPSDSDASGEGTSAAADSGSTSATDGTSTGASTSTTIGTTSSSAESNGESSADSSSDSSTSTGEPPYPEACEAPEATIDVTSAVTPEGLFEVDEAWIGLDYCSDTPFIMLAQNGSRRTGPAQTIQLRLPYGDFQPGPWFGLYPAEMSSGIQPTSTMATIDVLEPFEGDAGVPDPNVRMHARIEAHDSGWDLAVEIDLIYCGAADCFCPCR